MESALKESEKSPLTLKSNKVVRSHRRGWRSTTDVR